MNKARRSVNLNDHTGVENNTAMNIIITVESAVIESRCTVTSGF